MLFSTIVLPTLGFASVFSHLLILQSIKIEIWFEFIYYTQDEKQSAEQYHIVADRLLVGLDATRMKATQQSKRKQKTEQILNSKNDNVYLCYTQQYATRVFPNAFGTLSLLLLSLSGDGGDGGDSICRLLSNVVAKFYKSFCVAIRKSPNC